jgi:type II secretory pathway pseudopilin PulG
MEPQAKKSKLPLILVGCGVLALLLVIGGGIVAAIAIPAFMNFTNRAKGAEAQMNTAMIANLFAGQYMSDCEFPPSAAPTSALPVGGAKVVANFAGPGWDAISVPFNQSEMFFSYRTENRGDSLAVIAEADFQEGGPKHTVTVVVTGSKDDSGCSADVGSPVKENEME